MKSTIEIAIDNTANFVAKNGEQFEQKIRDNFNGNSIYSFLDPKDPLYQLYLLKKRQYSDKQAKDDQSWERPRIKTAYMMDEFELSVGKMASLLIQEKRKREYHNKNCPFVSIKLSNIGNERPSKNLMDRVSEFYKSMHIPIAKPIVIHKENPHIENNRQGLGMTKEESVYI